MYDIIKEVLISKTDDKRLQEALVYIKNNLIDTNGGMY